MRVVSLLPAATEIVCAIPGGSELLVGRSHECDFPRRVVDRPVLTRARRDLPRSSDELDRSIHELVERALAIYEIDIEALREARPDIIITQDLCEVCAVSLNDVTTALRQITDLEVQVVTLRPSRLADVWSDVVRVGRAIDKVPQAAALAQTLAHRCKRIEQHADLVLRDVPSDQRPRVLSLEWLAPPMVGGTWMPEMIRMAGGNPLVTEPGQHAKIVRAPELRDLAPDVVLLKPCSFTLERLADHRDELADLPFDAWPATAQGRIFATDGDAFFNRPGPRLVESLEILAACIQPDVFPEFVEAHADQIRRVRPDGALVNL